MRAALCGAGGMLAYDVLRHAPPGCDVTPYSHADLDVTDEDAVRRALTDASPDLVLNCAAYTDVDGAERESATAFRVNGDAPGILGRAVARLNDERPGARAALLVHFSTDYVFDGRARAPYSEDADVAPLGVYGKSKLAGERALAGSGAPYVVVRTQWLFGLRGRSFPRTMWERATAAKATRVVNDQFGRPTYTVDLAQAVWQLVESLLPDLPHGGAGGQGSPPRWIFHVAGVGVATWFDVAQRVFTTAGCEQLLTPCSSAKYPTAAPRPAWSVLDISRAEARLGRAMPAWDAALARFLEELRETS